MALKTITYNSSSRLSCGNSLPADVVICLPASLITAKFCPEQVEVAQPYDYGFIEGTVIAQKRLTGCGCGQLWQYTIQFESTQLLDADAFQVCYIQGIFFKGCFARWVEDLVGAEPYIYTDEDGNRIFVSPHGCEYLTSPEKSCCWGEAVYGNGDDGNRIVTGGSEQFPFPVRTFYYNNLNIAEGAVMLNYGPSCGYEGNYNYGTAVIVAKTLNLRGTISADAAAATDMYGALSPVLNFTSPLLLYDDGGDGGYSIQGITILPGDGPGRILTPCWVGWEWAVLPYMYGNYGGNGGNGGRYGQSGGGAAGYVMDMGSYDGYPAIMRQLPLLGNGPYRIGGGCGGGGGGEGGHSTTPPNARGGYGGGGGGGGGAILICAKDLHIYSTGKISAKGGAGAAGGNGSVSNPSLYSADGGGGGGGGGGGFIMLVYERLYDGTTLLVPNESSGKSIYNLWRWELAGGAGGAGGLGAGLVGANGVAGNAGLTGKIVGFNLLTSKFEFFST